MVCGELAVAALENKGATVNRHIGRWGPEPRLEIGNPWSEARWLRYWNMWREDCHHMGPDPEERYRWRRAKREMRLR